MTNWFFLPPTTISLTQLTLFSFRHTNEKATPRANHFHPCPAGHSGESVRQNALSRYLHARRSCAENQFARVACPGKHRRIERTIYLPSLIPNDRNVALILRICIYLSTSYLFPGRVDPLCRNWTVCKTAHTHRHIYLWKNDHFCSLPARSDRYS